MKEYTLYFSIFDKKMKWTTEANNLLDAEQKLKNKIIIHSHTKKEKTNPKDYQELEDNVKDMFGDIFGGLIK